MFPFRWMLLIECLEKETNTTQNKNNNTWRTWLTISICGYKFLCNEIDLSQWSKWLNLHEILSRIYDKKNGFVQRWLYSFPAKKSKIQWLKSLTWQRIVSWLCRNKTTTQIDNSNYTGYFYSILFPRCSLQS